MSSTDLVPRKRGPLTRIFSRRDSGVDAPVISFDDWLGMFTQFTFGGTTYGAGLNFSNPGVKQEQIAHEFSSFARMAYKSNGAVFALMAVRAAFFSEARMKFRSTVDGHLFGNPNLALLETPWVGGTTGDLLSRMLQHADLGGNSFVVRDGQGLRILRPDWVQIVAGSNDPDATLWDVSTELAGYVYQPGGPGGGRSPVFYLPEEVAHFAPIPDPEARFRGMSWLTPAIRDIMADKAFTEHALSSMENAATPNLVVKFDEPDLEKFQAHIRRFKLDHEGARNAYKTLFLSQGMDATPVGASLKESDFANVRGGGETRLAADAGVPPIVVGFSEGLQASTYSNYGQAMRRFSDLTMRPLWRNVCGSLAVLVTVPSQSELWYDGSDIAALQEDEKDLADILFVDAQSVRQLTDAGFTPESAVAAVSARDLSALAHSGMFSVQLQPPGTPNVNPPGPVPIPRPGNGQPPSREVALEALERAARRRVE